MSMVNTEQVYIHNAGYILGSIGWAVGFTKLHSDGMNRWMGYWVKQGGSWCGE